MISLAALETGRHAGGCRDHRQVTVEPHAYLNAAHGLNKPKNAQPWPAAACLRPAAPAGGFDAIVSLQIASTDEALHMGAADGVALALQPLPYELLADI